MSGCRQFVQRLGRPRNLAAAWVVLAAIRLAQADDGPIEAHAFAREYAPGEVVRFDVSTGIDVSEMRGEFRGSPLTLVRVPGAGHLEFVGWGVIPLGTGPGAAVYRMTGKRADGSSVSTSGEIAVTEKSFPEQRLTVEPKFVNPPKSASARIAREKKKLAAIYARRTSLPPLTSPFVKPVPGEPTSEFGARRILNGEPRAPHPGIDLQAATGTAVRVAGPGRVALATDLYYSGGTVIVDHGAGLFTVYAHLSKIGTEEGATLKTGDAVGLSGATGRVTGPHLHWGARVGDDIFDPRALLDPRLFGP
jgi:hypothetical protein